MRGLIARVSKRSITRSSAEKATKNENWPGKARPACTILYGVLADLGTRQAKPVSMNVTNKEIARQAAASCLFLVANATRVFVSVYYFCAMEKFEFVVSRRACCIRHMDFYKNARRAPIFKESP